MNNLAQQPAIRLLYRIDANEKALQPVRDALGGMIPHGFVLGEEVAVPADLQQRTGAGPLMGRAGYGERLVTLRRQPAADGSQSALDYVVLPRQQRLHIHPHGHRLLVIRTGHQPGVMEWFAPAGPLQFARKQALAGEQAIAEGGCAGAHHTYRLEPYSCYAVELAGGVHKFGGVTILSYHSYDAPPAPSTADSQPTNSIWKGAVPDTKIALGEATPLFTLHTPHQWRACDNAILDRLESLVERGPQSVFRPVMQDFLEGLCPGYARDDRAGNIPLQPAAPLAARGR